jgi:phenylacetate-CoA ligase
MSDELRRAEPALALSRDALEALQLERLKGTLRRAHWVEHYRRKCEAAQVHPDDLKSLDDLARFPFTTKEDLREAYPFGMFAVPREAIVRIHASSGTTGKPTIVGYTEADVRTWSSLVARSIRVAGGRPGDIVHVAYGYGLFTGGLGAHYGAEALGCTVIPMSGGMTERQVQFIRDLRPDIIMVTPSYMLAIADEFERQGLDPAASSLRIGIHGAEPWTDAMRQEIERRCGMAAVDIYGLSEIMGPGVANEFADAKDGSHVWEDHFLPEIIDPATGSRVADGEAGELVLTTLTREAMPVVRYRTRDRTRLLPGSRCAMRRMARIAGRTDDMLIIRGVNLFPSQVEELILKEPMLAPHYVLEVTREGRLDELKVVVELRQGSPGEATLRTALEARLAHLVKAYIGVTCTVEIAPEGSVERSIGKARRIIDKRPKT